MLNKLLCFENRLYARKNCSVLRKGSMLEKIALFGEQALLYARKNCSGSTLEKIALFGEKALC